MNIPTRLLFAGVLSLSGFAVHAQSAPEPVAAPQAEAQARADDPHCLRYTGSLVVAARNAREDRDAKASGEAADANDAQADRGRCVYSSGRAYSQDDLRRTGETDIGRALQMLDPSVTVGH